MILECSNHDWAVYQVIEYCRGFQCLNELGLGVPLKPAMSSIFRQKLTPPVYKAMVLEARRFGAKEELESGIVDILGGLEELLRFFEERKLTEKAKTGVYGNLKAEIFREALGYLEGYDVEEQRTKDNLENDDKRKEQEETRFAEGIGVASKAKL